MTIESIVIVVGALIGATLMVAVIDLVRDAKAAMREDFGPEEDAGIWHVCWKCGVPLGGAEGGVVRSDMLCIRCWHQESAPDDQPTAPRYVATH